MRHLLSSLLIAWLAFSALGCARFAPPRHVASVSHLVKTSAYCACGQCCGWRRNWLGRPVYAYGPSKGKPKSVGITATGTRARHGTIAADPLRYPYGTIMYIPGYGLGRVEDCGAAIKGDRLDLFFTTHRAALEWGRRTVRADVWFLPGKYTWSPDLSQRLEYMASSISAFSTGTLSNATAPKNTQRPTLASLSIPCCGDDIADILTDTYPELPAMLEWSPSLEPPVVEINPDLLRGLIPSASLESLMSATTWIDMIMTMVTSPTPLTASEAIPPAQSVTPDDNPPAAEPTVEPAAGSTPAPSDAEPSTQPTPPETP